MGAKTQPISPPFGHKAGLPPSKKYLLVRQPLLAVLVNDMLIGFADLFFHNLHNTTALLFQHILTGTVKVHTVDSVAFFTGNPFLHLAVVAVGWIR